MMGVSPSPAPAPSPTDPVADPGPTDSCSRPDGSAWQYTVFNVISDWGSGFTGEVAVEP